MLKFDNLKQALNEFGDKVVQDAKSNLKSRDKVASGKLYESMKNNGAKVSKRSFELNVNMAYYGAFVDQGVSGVQKKYNTPYSYTNKMPPPSAFDSWIVKRGIAPRNEKGQFLTRKSIQFAMSNHIFNYGIKPSYFLTDAVKSNFKILPEMVEKSFGLDAQKALEFMIKSNFNTK